jgi:hypothetical protein
MVQEFVVNQHSEIRRRMDQLEAERNALLRQPAQATIATEAANMRQMFDHPVLQASPFWHGADIHATSGWFDQSPTQPDQTYIMHISRFSMRQRRQMASRPYVNPGSGPDPVIRMDNTVTLFARLIELEIISL